MDALLERLRRKQVLVADGGQGTMYMARGLEAGAAPESLALSRPEVLEEVAALYAEAGAELLTTNTFGATPLNLERHGLAEHCEEINRAAVSAARKAAGERAYVNASVGPSGRLLLPYGDTEPEVVQEAFERQMRGLAEGGPDLVCVETMTDLSEATMAVKAAKATMPDVPVMATMTFDATPRGFFTVMGVSVERAAAGLAEAGADIVGSNCGNGIEVLTRIAKELVAATRLPVAIQANAGLPETKDGTVVYPETPEFFAEHAADLLSLGVAIIGGCCGTTPDHIRALRQLVDSRQGRG
jgi:5-methyltetrahydrofolate--homocysteine methyltransferase